MIHEIILVRRNADIDQLEMLLEVLEVENKGDSVGWDSLLRICHLANYYKFLMIDPYVKSV